MLSHITIQLPFLVYNSGIKAYCTDRKYAFILNQHRKKIQTMRNIYANISNKDIEAKVNNITSITIFKDG